MRTRHLLAALIVAGLALVISLPSPADEAPSKEKIDKLIEQLGSGTFSEREKATKELAAIGLPALEALRKAAKSDDAEVRKRAEELLPKIEKQAENIRVLAPKRVHLVYKDAPLSEALADFQKKSGYKIHLHDPDGKLKERKIALDTGETTFWHAVALFCDKAELSEMSVEELVQALKKSGGVPAVPPGTNGQLVLKDGKAKQLPTDDRSAVRIRVLPWEDQFGDVAQDEILLPLEVALEQKLRWQFPLKPFEGPVELVQSIRVDKAVDDQNQELTQLSRHAMSPQQRERVRKMEANIVWTLRAHRLGWGWLSHVGFLHLRKGAKGANALKELKGSFTAQLRIEARRSTIVADKLDKAAGKTFMGDEGSSIRIINVSSEENQTTIALDLDRPESDKIVRESVEDSRKGLSIQDDKGNALPIDGRRSKGVNGILEDRGRRSKYVHWKLVCPHDKDKGKPAKVVYCGRKRVTVEIPFALKDVPLP